LPAKKVGGVRKPPRQRKKHVKIVGGATKPMIVAPTKRTKTVGGAKQATIAASKKKPVGHGKAGKK
jgi:hypothetical protein